MRIGKVRYLAPVAALVLVASACGGGDDREDAQEQVASLAAEDLNPAPREELREGGSFVWAISAYDQQHNMWHTQGNMANVRRVAAAVLPNPTRYDVEGLPSPNEDFVLDFGVSDDGIEVFYELNPDAVWSDGKPITSEDYEAQVETVSGSREGDWELGGTDGYDQIAEFVPGDDEYSFTLRFDAPFAEWPSLFSPLYPKEYMEDEELFKEGYVKDYPVTAGPFGNVEFDDVTERITITRNEDWWGTEPLLDEIVFDAMGTDAMAGAFNNGEIDGFYLGYDAAGYELLRDREGAYFTRAVNHAYRFASLNGASPNLEDVRVRHAISLGLDTDALAEIALGAVDWPITGETNRLLRSSQNGYQDNSEGYGEYDPERAGELLDEAGWILEEGAEFRTNAEGETLSLDWVASDDMAIAQDEAEIGRDMLAEIGVEVKVQQVPNNALFSEYVIPGNYEVATYVLAGSHPYAGDAQENYGMPDQDGEWGNNLTRISTEEIDRKFGEMRSETDPDRYAELANEIDRLLWEEVATIPFFERPGLYVMNEDLHNWGEFGLASEYVYEDIGWAAE
ncbi:MULTISPECIES: ABC transporter family substrate-binding protein [Nocardiopsis]|uniref:Extracellular solute-binding protein family 5 n=1 Tax=Nocardiopsis dassonvillei (strain ATCC 23218 / DSM 43111 / CIP 107115 / JCM 7437 / KCTC 9190 / NBRC 14626 / NCTC 10488 / NRRL B-5397 / IMRU 509) TaxID=446468 RepID=D7AXA9_NOCDD|nr:MULTISPECIES: ABC transporter family substrate-binding protein [Nocardiopsis]ADH65983.1 extracellular solute-binding protein family 5 [Nocardiopsis dassonvillei subsp. dassonvillei DSM 43111]APC34303.1 ABC transporter substrate-binding protein [Nocardiopsis dassonvillei]MCP3016416.1 ABC transporter family substrate-binding protein [Nocardiopsis dassonvillei]NKY79003.1 ABC transporter family substrate-binding protein [Nocardiopsis dassonvillei]VEI92004.1 Probable monoacyl phosphatidylinosito